MTDSALAPRPIAPTVPTGLPLWAAILIAAAAGVILDGAFPDRGWWPLAFLGIGMALVSLIGRSIGGALLVGLVFGWSFYGIHIEWATVFLGPVPWAALTTLMALWCALGAVLITLAYRWVPRVFPTALGRLLFTPVVVAGLWILREAVASVWPYGGFAWGRVSESQSASPIAPLFAWLGVSGVGFVMVALVAVAIAAFGARDVRLDLRALLVASLATVLLVFPAWPTPTDGTLRVGAVQGNGKTGYFHPAAAPGDNLLAQYTATEPVYDQNVDVVVWPEDGSDLDPIRVPEAAQVFDSVSQRAKAPLVAGTITMRGEDYFNTSLDWVVGKGVVDYYDKKHPVPFGEYVPDRAFWHQFAPSLIDLIARGYTPGTTDDVMDVGKAVAGIAICFDIVDDTHMTETVRQGAQIVFAQTNNADFGRTDESVQQLAIARIRAIELARPVVNISTVGTSAVILADGAIIDQLPWYTADSMVDDVPLGSTTTPAVIWGHGIELLAGGVAVGALVVAGIFRPRRNRRD